MIRRGAIAAATRYNDVDIAIIDLKGSAYSSISTKHTDDAFLFLYFCDVHGLDRYG